jgi:ATP-dependent RNA helicase RhlE
VPSNTFSALGLPEPLLRALEKERFVEPTPIQASTIPHLLAGRDLLGIAQTGTGKTAAFAMPMLHHLASAPGRAAHFATRALILAPTRELALQIEDSLRRLAGQLPLRIVAILGGVSRFAQVQRMRGGVDIVVGTPGRVCDLMATDELKLYQVSQFVLDEADRMLDLGFIRDIRRIVAALPGERQSALFSATMPPEVAKLAGTLLLNPLRVDVAQSAMAPLPIEQHVHFVEPAGKRALLGRMRHRVHPDEAGSNQVADALDTGGMRVVALHGNKSQPARQKALEQFRAGRARVLVATDLAARGIDVTSISHVINFDLPAQPEDYVHRIGRTARAGASGIAISFCDSAQRGALRAIERMTGTRLQIAGCSPPAVQPQRTQAHTESRPPRRRRQARSTVALRPAA